MGYSPLVLTIHSSFITFQQRFSFVELVFFISMYSLKARIRLQITLTTGEKNVTALKFSLRHIGPHHNVVYSKSSHIKVQILYHKELSLSLYFFQREA